MDNVLRNLFCLLLSLSANYIDFLCQHLGYLQRLPLTILGWVSEKGESGFKKIYKFANQFTFFLLIPSVDRWTQIYLQPVVELMSSVQNCYQSKRNLGFSLIRYSSQYLLCRMCSICLSTHLYYLYIV